MYNKQLLLSYFEHVSPSLKEEVNDIIQQDIFENYTYIPLKELNFSSKSAVFASTLGKFTASIKENGFFTPVVVDPQTLTVEDGIKRCKAALTLGIDVIPCAYTSSSTATDTKIVELISSDKPDFFDTAILVNTLIKHFLYTQDALSAFLNVSQSYIANKQRLLKLSPEERSYFKQLRLSERICRSLLRINDKETRLSAATVIYETSLTVGAAEKYIDTLIESGSPADSASFARRTAGGIQRIVDSSLKDGTNVVLNRQEDANCIKLNIIISKCST